MKTRGLIVFLVTLAAVLTGLVGCKTKTKQFEGVFKIIISADIRKLISEKLVKTPFANRGSEELELMKEFEKSTLTVNPNGTFSMYDPIDKECKGTYKLVNDKITLTYDATVGTTVLHQVITLVYDEKAQTLTRDFQGTKLLYKKK